MPKISPARAEAQRRRIIAAATECFAKHGLQRTTMSDIFAQSGLSAGAVYGYFRGKQEIVAAVATERHAREAQLLKEVASSSRPLADFVDLYFSQILGADQQEQRRVMVQYWAGSLLGPGLRAVARDGLRSLQTAESLVADAQRARKIRSDIDPATLSRMILALLQGFVLQLCWEPNLDTGAFRAALLAMVQGPPPRRGQSGRSRVSIR